MSDAPGESKQPGTAAAPGRWVRRSVIVSAVALAALVAALVAVHWPTSHTFYTDADTIEEPEDTAPVRDILWQPPALLPAMAGRGADDFEPRLTADGMTLFFVRGKAGTNSDIFYRNRTPEGWSEPAPLAAVNTGYDELGPEPSADGLVVYFYSDRPGGFGGYDIWYVRRSRTDESGWSEPMNLGPPVNSELNEYGPALTPDGAALYFASNRPQPGDSDPPDPDAWPGTIREDLYHRTYDIYTSQITERGAARAQAIAALNTPFNEGAPAVSSFGDFLYFASDRPGGEGGFDLYRSRRLRGGHEPAVNLGATLNTPANELDPGLSMGGYSLYFSSDRPRERVAPDRRNPYQIYQTTSREVFTDSRTEQASIDWAAIWSALWPNLLWVLLALLLLLLLLAMLRDLKGRKLSLLARCLLASLFAHVVIMFLLTAWQMTESLAQQFGRKGPIQVALGPSAAGADVFSQVRGAFTSAGTAVSIILESDVRPAATNPQIQAAMITTPVAATPRDAGRRPLDISLAADADGARIESLPIQAAPASPNPRRASFDVDLPADESRIHQTESELPAAPAEATIRNVNLPPVSPDARSTAASTIEVAVATKSSPAYPSLESALVSTDMLTVHDTDTRKMPTTRPVTAKLAADQLTPAAVTLPRSTSDHQRADESQIPVPQSAPPRATALPRPAVSQATDDFEQIKVDEVIPGRKSTQSDEPLTVDELAANVADASRGVPAFAAGKTRADAPTSLHVADVSLPQPAEATDGDNAEVEFKPHNEPHRNVQPPSGHIDSAAEPAGTHIVSITPAKPSGTALASLTPDTSIARLRDAALHRPATPPARSTPVGAPAPSETTLDLYVPTDIEPPPSEYSHRSAAERAQAVEEMGGGKETEDAVALALRWLAEHQSPDGRWDGAGFDETCGRCGGETKVEVDVALTGLSLLCFLAADHTHLEDGEYRHVVRRAVDWLIDIQRSDGDLRGPETMYSHGIAAIALAESYGMTRDPRLREPVQAAIGFIERSYDAHTGIWRYDPGQPGDTSVLGWQIMALKSAKQAGIEVPSRPFLAAGRWLDTVSSTSSPGLYAYQPGRPATPAMTAEGLFVQEILGRATHEPRMRQSVELIMGNLPDWKNNLNTYYWYYATLALFHQQGGPWQRWNDALTAQLLPNQHKRGPRAGSWDAEGEWAHVGGRVYQTALCTLMLEVYYRYLPLFLRDPGPGEDAIGTVRGHVTHASTGDPIAGAKVRLDLADDPDIEILTAPDGSYVLHPTNVPPFFALSASAAEFLPTSHNVAAAAVAGKSLDVDFELTPENAGEIAIEAVPAVHHLGDDEFSGSINSQFQKRAEGATFLAEFTLTADQLSPSPGSAEVLMLVKGVQLEHRIRINGRTIVRRLSSAPRDGSFGPFAARFDPAWLQPGPNVIEILASSLGTDVDDFEFVNVKIRVNSWRDK